MSIVKISNWKFDVINRDKTVIASFSRRWLAVEYVKRQGFKEV